jgi:hypothetical protein
MSADTVPNDDTVKAKKAKISKMRAKMTGILIVALIAVAVVFIVS